MRCAGAGSFGAGLLAPNDEWAARGSRRMPPERIAREGDDKAVSLVDPASRTGLGQRGRSHRPALGHTMFWDRLRRRTDDRVLWQRDLGDHLIIELFARGIAALVWPRQ